MTNLGATISLQPSLEDLQPPRSTKTWCWLALAIVVAYLPTLVTPHLYLDDYAIFYDAKPKVVAWSPVSWEMCSFFSCLGRPGANLHLILCGALLQLPGGNSLCYALDIFGAILMAWGTTYWLTMNGVSTRNAACFSFLMALLPSTQIYVLWLTAGSALFAASMAIAGLILLEKWLRQGKPAIGVLCALALLITAQMTYQPASMVYWALALAGLLFRQGRTAKQTCQTGVIYFLVGGVSIALYYVSLKFGLKLFGLTPSSRATLLPAADIPAKLAWFFKIPFYQNACSLWWFWPSTWLNSSVGVLFTTGMLAKLVLLVRSERQAETRQPNSDNAPAASATEGLLYTFGVIILALGMVFSCHVYNLLVKETWGAFRSCLGISTAVLVTIYYLGTTLGNSECCRSFTSHLKNPLRCLVAIIALVLAQRLMTNSMLIPQQLEQNWLHAEVRQLCTTETKAIHAIRPAWNEGICQNVRFDEFGLPSSFGDWVPVPMLRKTLLDLGQDPGQFTLTTGLAADPIPPGEGVVVIDFRKLMQLRESGPLK